MGKIRSVRTIDPRARSDASRPRPAMASERGRPRAPPAPGGSGLSGWRCTTHARQAGPGRDPFQHAPAWRQVEHYWGGAGMS